MSDFDRSFGDFLGGSSVATGGPVATVAPAAAPADDFARSFETSLDAAEPHVRDAKLNLFEANKINPDEAAKAATLATTTGLPADTVERNRSQIEEDVRAISQSQTMAQNPHLARFYAERRNAVVASDDFAKLDVLSKIWEAGSRGVGDAFRGNAAARAALPFLGGEMSPEVAAQAKYAQAAAAAPFGGDDNSFYKFVKGSSGFIGGLVDQTLHSLSLAVGGAITGAAVGAVGGPAAPLTSAAGAVLGFTAGFTAGMVKDGYEVGAGQLYLQLKDQTDKAGNKLDPETVRWAAHGGGIVLGMLNIIGAKGVEQSVGAAAKGAATLFAKEVVTQPTLQRAMADFGKGMAKGVGVGAGFGAANEATMILAETIAKEVSSGDWETIVNSPEERKVALDRLAAAMIEMGAAFGVMHGAGRSVKLAGDMRRVRQAERDIAWIDGVGKAVTETKTAGRDRDAVKRFLEMQADGSPVENVFLPSGKVVELYQSYGLDPFAPGFKDPIMGWLPDIGDQLTQALDTGGDIVVPAKDYFARLAGTEVFDKLREDVRVRQDGMSFREARDAQQQRMAEVEQGGIDWSARVAAGEDYAAPAVRVHDDMFDKLRAAGYTVDVANKYAAIYAARYTSRAARNGDVDAFSSYLRSDVSVHQVLPESIRYAKPDQLDVLLNSIRSGKDPVIPKDSAASLLDYISARGGMVDAGGELKARDLDKWHLSPKGRPIKGKTPLIVEGAVEQGNMFGNLNGGDKRTFHDTAIAAWEAGYFPHLVEPPTQDMLLRAIDDELRGVRQVSEDAPYDPRDTFRADRVALDETLNRLGLDVKKLRNKEIREALAQVADGEGGYEQSAYHGGPHIFDRFSIDKVGTGEGAQAFGWGLYFASNKEIAQWYRDTLKTRPLGADALKSIREVDPSLNLTDEQASGIYRAIEDKTDASTYAKRMGYRHAELRGKEPEIAKVIEAVREKTKGRLYHVDIPEDGAYLLWDKPLAEQPPAVKAALAKLGVKDEGAPKPPADRAVAAIVARAIKANDGDFRDIALTIDNDRGLYDLAAHHAKRAGDAMEDGPGAYIETLAADYLKALEANERNTGETVYKSLVDAATTQITEEAKTFADGGPMGRGVAEWNANPMRGASMLLRDQGIAGIKYLDGTGRDAGEGHHNYVLFDDANVSIREYEQQARGSIKFDQGRAIISLFKGRNLSTFLHETGHLWLEEMRADAMRPGAHDQVKADFALMLDAIGARGKEIERHHHETFARMAETYFMEGKAPSEGLVQAFRAFKQWLVAIYRSVASLDAPVSPEIRGVFDRLLATDAEISAAKERQGLNPVFASAEAAGMTKAEFAAYTKAIASAADRTESAALNAVMADVRRRRTKEWKDEETATREDVTRETMLEPGQSALHLFRTGKLWEGETPDVLKGAKLGKDEIVAMYGDETALKMLPRGIYKEKGDGLGADMLAEALGFPGGRAMLDHLMALEAQRVALREKGDKRSVARALIEEETERRMTERHGEALTDGSIEAEAMAAVHSDRQAAVLATEMKALGKMAGQPAAIGWKDIKAWAVDAIADKRIKDGVASARFAKAERDAGMEVQRALLAGKTIEAFKAKQRQLVNHALYIESKKAADEATSAVKLMDRYASAKTLKAMDQGYLEQIHNLLERFDFKRASEKALEKRADFAEWAIQQQAAGIDVVASAKFMNSAFRTHFSDMTVGELRGLTDTVKQIAHLGRRKKEWIVNAEKREFDATVAEAVSVVEGIRQLRVPDERDPKEAGNGLGEKARALVERVKGGAISFDASLLKMEQVFDWLDNGNPNGIFNGVFRMISEAQTLEAKLQAETTRKLLALNRALPKETAREWNTRHEIPELIDSKTGKASSMLKSKVIAIALNTGSESNFDKMARGEKWDRDAIKVVLDRMLTAKDWEYVQGVWDTIGTLWPYIEAMEKAVNGVAPPKVEARIVDTPHGSFRGGYYPAVYDPLRSGDVADRGAKSADSLFENVYTRATTSRGFANERVETYARPFLLSLDVIPRHVSEVVHDIAFRESVRQADKLLSNSDIRAAVEGALGREVYSQFRPWLQNIANEWALDRRGLGFWDNVAKGARTSASIVGMGFRITTMLAQVSGLSDSAEAIGPKWVMKGIGEFVGNPAGMAKTRDFVFEKSGEMRNRMDTTERDVRDAMRGLIGKTGFLNETRRFAYYGIAMLDMGVSLPTWMGAYRKALHEGMSDADAVYAADKGVRNSQGAGAAKDMAAIARGTETQKLFTMFYSYFSHQYNRTRNIVRDARNVENAGDVAMIAARSFFLLVAPTIIGNLVSGQGPKDDENAAAWAARKVAVSPFLGVPVLRDVVNLVERKWSGEFSSYSATPAARAVDVLEKTANDFVQAIGAGNGEVSDQWVKHALETSGYIFGLPTGQLGNTSQFLWDVYDGQQNPADIADWFKGLIYGKYEDRKK